MINIRTRREALGLAPLASMAPAAPRRGERPTVAGVVRRHLSTVKRKAIGRAVSAATLPCGHPADQPHDRFHALPTLRAGALTRSF